MPKRCTRSPWSPRIGSIRRIRRNPTSRIRGGPRSSFFAEIVVDDTSGLAGLARRYLPEILPVHQLVARLLRSLAAGARGRLQSICLVLLLLAGGAVGRSSELQLSTAKPLADQEPITPIPQPAAVDPRRLALGERLFGDPRLSGDGKLACSSCHDLQTNGAGNGKNSRNDTHDPSKHPFNTLSVFNA